MGRALSYRGGNFGDLVLMIQMVTDLDMPRTALNAGLQIPDPVLFLPRGAQPSNTTAVQCLFLIHSYHFDQFLYNFLITAFSFCIFSP